MFLWRRWLDAELLEFTVQPPIKLLCLNYAARNPSGLRSEDSLHDSDITYRSLEPAGKKAATFLTAQLSFDLRLSA